MLDLGRNRREAKIVRGRSRGPVNWPIHTKPRSSLGEEAKKRWAVEKEIILMSKDRY